MLLYLFEAYISFHNSGNASLIDSLRCLSNISVYFLKVSNSCSQLSLRFFFSAFIVASMLCLFSGLCASILLRLSHCSNLPAATSLTCSGQFLKSKLVG